MSRDKIIRDKTQCSGKFRAQWIGFFIFALLVSGLSGRSDAATITVVKSGTGTGIVTSAPAGINCGIACSSSAFIDEVILTATPDLGSVFVSWTGCTSVDANGLCHWAGGATTTVTANFASLNDRIVKINSLNNQCSTVSACVKVTGTAGLLTNLTKKTLTSEKMRRSRQTLRFKGQPAPATRRSA